MVEGTIQAAWKQAKSILKVENNLAPTCIVNQGQVVTNPTVMANCFNDYFVEKVKRLCGKTSSVPIYRSIDRLRKWLIPRKALQHFN